MEAWLALMQPPPARKSGENCQSFSYCTLVCTEATIFCRKNYVTCFVSRRRLCHFSTKKDESFYGAKWIFRSFATFFDLTIFDQVTNKGFLFTDCRSVWIHTARIQALRFLKVSKFQNENMKSSHCPKYERKNLKNSALSIHGKIFQIFLPYFGQCDNFILSF